MTKMEKELIEKLERTCQTEARVTLRLIRKLQKENEELKEILHKENERIIKLNKIIERSGEKYE